MARAIRKFELQSASHLPTLCENYAMKMGLKSTRSETQRADHSAHSKEYPTEFNSQVYLLNKSM